MNEWMNEWMTMTMTMTMTISLFNPMQPSSRSRQFPHLWAPAVFHLRRQLVTRWAPRKTMHRLVESKSLMCIENIWELPDPHKVPNSWGYMLFGTFIFTFRNVPSFCVNALGIMEGFLKSVPKAHGWNWSRSNGLPKSAAKSFKEVWFVAVVPGGSPAIPDDPMPSWFFKSFKRSTVFGALPCHFNLGLIWFNVTDFYVYRICVEIFFVD